MNSNQCSGFVGSTLRPLISLICITSTCLMVSPANAQSLALESGSTLQEIVVTAEKRESTVQKTPFSITAISGQQLEAEGLATIKDVAAETPGISIRSSGPGQTEYEMRGLPSSGGSSATVGLYLNDVPLSAPAASLNGKVTIDPDLFDLNRIEVLRGPQGTLYGSGSMGGTIKLVINEPVMNRFIATAQTIFSGTTGGGFNYGGSAMVNLPMVDDRVAARLVGTYKYTDGWIDRIVVNPFPIGPSGSCGFGSCTRGDVASAPVSQVTPRSNWERLSGGRGSLLFKPTDALSIDMLAMYQGITMGGFSEVDVPPGPDVLAHYQPFNIAEPYTDIIKLYSLTINYDLGFAQLTNATSKWLRDSIWTGDESEVMQSLLSGLYGFPPLLATAYSNADHSQQASEELRLTSNQDGEFQWVVGGFYSNFESIFSQYTVNPAYTAISTGGAAANPNGILYQAYQPYHIKQYAAFGDASYKFTDTVKATVGARWYKYNTELNYEQLGVYTENGNATPFTGSVKANDSGVNPKFNLAYIPNGDLTVYMEIARGFRPGGVNLPIPVPPCTTEPSESYQPDSIWNYEVGEKAKFLDGRMTINSDFYYIVWKNVQQLLTPPCAFPYTANAGTAISYGPELELSAKLTPNLTVDLNGTYTDAHLKDLAASAVGLTIGSTTKLTPGMPLENVPRYTINVSASYDFPVSDTYKVLARIDGTRVGSFYDISYYFQQLPAYTILNARVGLLGGRFVPYVFVDNLVNKHAEVTINTMSWAAPIPSLTRPAITTPRTIGIDLQYRF